MFMQVIHFIMDAGSSVFMPIIILILGLIFGLKPGKPSKQESLWASDLSGLIL